MLRRGRRGDARPPRPPGALEPARAGATVEPSVARAKNIRTWLTSPPVAAGSSAASLDEVSGGAAFEGQGLSPPARPDAEYEGEVARARLLLRFAIGVAELG